MSVFLIEQPYEELRALSDFQHRAELIGVRVKRFCARSVENEPEIKEGLELDLKHRVTRAESREDCAFFDVEIEMDALGDKDPAKLLFHIDCCFSLEYRLVSGYTPKTEELDAFKRGNAVFHCWPYLREFVQTSVQRMGLSVPPIPLLRLQPLPPKDASSEIAPPETPAGVGKPLSRRPRTRKRKAPAVRRRP